jgi:hypothetical protein
MSILITLIVTSWASAFALALLTAVGIIVDCLTKGTAP